MEFIVCINEYSLPIVFWIYVSIFWQFNHPEKLLNFWQLIGHSHLIIVFKFRILLNFLFLGKALAEREVIKNLKIREINIQISNYVLLYYLIFLLFIWTSLFSEHFRHNSSLLIIFIYIYVFVIFLITDCTDFLTYDLILDSKFKTSKK